MASGKNSQPYHGRSHAAGGSDPIKGVVYLSKQNGIDPETLSATGDYFYVNASGPNGIVLGGNGVGIGAQGGDVNISSAEFMEVDVYGGFQVNSQGYVSLLAGSSGGDGTIALLAPGSTPDNGITLTGATVINLSTVGNHFGINDHTSAQIFAVFEDGTISWGGSTSGGEIDGGSP